MHILDKLLLLHNNICKYAFYLAAFLILVLAFSISYEVIVRYFFIKPTIWAMDFSEYILIYTTFLAIPWIFKIGGHTSISAIIDITKGKLNYILNIINYFICIFVSATIFYISIGETIRVFTGNILIIRPIIIPKWAIYIIIPFGFFMLLIYLIKQLFTFIINARTD